MTQERFGKRLVNGRPAGRLHALNEVERPLDNGARAVLPIDARRARKI
jgi:hypothetical protein